MALQGSLRELPLPDLIQQVSVSGKSGVISLEDNRAAARIFLRDGEVTHAEVAGIRGEEAIYELALWRDGDFHFAPDITKEPETGTIEKSTTALLLEAARRIDEWQILSKKIPSTRMIPVFPDTNQRGVSFNPDEWTVVQKIDERRSLEEIALLVGKSPFEIAKIAFGLVSTGVIEMREHAAFLEPQRLVGMESDALAGLTTRVYVEAFEQLPTNESLERLEVLHAATNPPGKPADAVAKFIDLVRGSQLLITADLGSERATQFYDKVEELLEAV